MLSHHTVCRLAAAAAALTEAFEWIFCVSYACVCVCVHDSFWTGTSLILKLVSVAALVSPRHANVANRSDTHLSKQWYGEKRAEKLPFITTVPLSSKPLSWLWVPSTEVSWLFFLQTFGSKKSLTRHLLKQEPLGGGVKRSPNIGL